MLILDDSYQVSGQSDKRFRFWASLKNFKIGAMAAIFGFRNNLYNSIISTINVVQQETLFEGVHDVV